MACRRSAVRSRLAPPRSLSFLAPGPGGVILILRVFSLTAAFSSGGIVNQTASPFPGDITPVR